MLLSTTFRRLRRIVLTLPVLATISSVALTPGPAAAAAPVADPAYTTQVRTQSVPSGPAYGAAYVDCPAGSLAIASGHVVGDPDGMLLSGSTTTAGTGAFGSAYLVTGGDLQVWTTCVAAARLQGATTASVTVRSSSSWRYHARQATCPDGTVAYGGGGNVVNSGVYDAAGLYTYGTVPDGRSWTYAGAGALGSRSLVVETHCLPRQRLGTIRVVEHTVISPDLTSRQHVSAAPRCPAGFFAFAGGGWFNTPGSGEPSWNGYLDANMMAADQRGWYVSGDAFNPRTRLTARVECTDRLG